MKSVEIKELAVGDLTERIDAEKVNLTRMKINHAISPVENPSTIKKARRDIARMLTVLREKQTVKN